MSNFDDLDKKPGVLIPEVKIQNRVEELALEINSDFQNQEITAICILKGSFVFFSDLIRHLDLPMSCEFLGVSSYGDKMVSSGEVKITLDINEPLMGKHVLIIEDIVDTGLTLNYIKNAILARKPATLKTCVLMVKPDCLKVPIEIDYTGFKIGNEFVVGYGIDYADRYRSLPYIGYLEQKH